RRNTTQRSSHTRTPRGGPAATGQGRGSGRCSCVPRSTSARAGWWSFALLRVQVLRDERNGGQQVLRLIQQVAQAGGPGQGLRQTGLAEDRTLVPGGPAHAELAAARGAGGGHPVVVGLAAGGRRGGAPPPG